MKRKEEYQDERWKERAVQIRELDNHKCAMCGAKDVELHVHHLSYPPPPFHLWDAADDELVTLCKDCHERVHKMVARPRLTENRELHTMEINTNRCKNDLCLRCQYYMQPYFLEDWEKEFFNGCDKLDGEGCNFKKVITCETCCYRTDSFLDDKKCHSEKDTVACQHYNERSCLTCNSFCCNAHDFGGYCNVVCGYVYGSDGICDDMRCNGKHYSCVVSNEIEMKEYLKQNNFD